MKTESRSTALECANALCARDKRRYADEAEGGAP
jgi:hypothetical protein